MKKCILSCLLVGLSFVTVKAQFEWGPKNKSAIGMSSPVIIGADEKTVFVYRCEPKSDVVEIFDKQGLTLSESIILPRQVENLQLGPIGFEKLNNKFIILYGGIESSRLELFYYAQTLDLETHSLSSLKLISKRPYLENSSPLPAVGANLWQHFKNTILSNEVRLVESCDDHSIHILVNEARYFHGLTKMNQTYSNDFKIYRINENLEVEEPLSFKPSSEHFTVAKVDVYNNDTLLICGSEDTSYFPDNDHISWAPYKHDIFLYDVHNGTMIEREIFSGNTTLSHSFTWPTSSGFVCFGVSEADPNGMIHFTTEWYDKNLNLLKTSTADAPDQLINSTFNEKQKDLDKSSSQVLSWTNSYEFLKDGDHGAKHLLIQQIMPFIHYSNGVVTVNYLIGNILALKFNGDGELIWQTVIQQFQIGDIQKFGGYWACIDENKLNIYFTESAKGMLEPYDGTTLNQETEVSKAFLTKVVIDQNGNKSKQKAMEYPKEKKPKNAQVITPLSSFQDNLGSVFFVAPDYYNKAFSLVKISK
ncbi:MAG: hypothetical protein IPM74_01185 [Crocinitomicaceae bacterium]|nr:hypothetical protein [Crocinitomicaceae bacterium]MBK8924531.1 hypothetical protein [Crocinitomicaceae bacterium]